MGKKCCWCCYHLRSILADDGAQFKLPRSHGIMYPWSPPRVGLDIKLLEVLEDALWRELPHAIMEQQLILLTRHSSGSSSPLEDEFIPPSKLMI